MQRKYRRLQFRFAETNESRLARKLDIISRKLLALNQKWKLGISTAMLTAWLAFTPGVGMAQVQSNIQLSQPEPSRTLRFPGVDDFDRVGRSVSYAGDLNADGYDDIVIGAELADPNGMSGAGTCYVVFGGPKNVDPIIDLTSLDGTNGFRLDGIAANDRTGQAVGSVGDINADGIDDLAIGASRSGVSDIGSVYIVFGKSDPFDPVMSLSSLNGANGFRLDGENGNDYVGESLSSAGDVNNDGISDLIIGAPGAQPGGSGEGSSYVVFGKNTPFDQATSLSSLGASDGFRLDGGSGDSAGRFVRGVGDINNDNIDDLIIGTDNTTSYVVLGDDAIGGSILDLSALDGYNGFQLTWSGASGSSVGHAGDINGDGIDDLIVGTYNNGPVGLAFSGSSYVLFGSADFGTAAGFGPALDLTTMDVSDGFSLDGVSSNDNSGNTVGRAGDVNGDGFDDLFVGAHRANLVGNGAGAAYVLFGSSDGFEQTISLSTLDGEIGRTYEGTPITGGEGERAGTSVSGAGDFNGDGLDDLVIGARGISTRGHVYLVFGSETDAPYVSSPLDRAADEDLAFSYAIADKFIDPEGSDVSFTASLSSGDPLPTWLSYDTESNTFSGTPRNSDVGVTSVSITATDPDMKSVTTHFKLEVLDAQSFPTDLTDLKGLNGFRLDGVNRFDFAGTSVSGAGDVNADGIDDLIIGADGADPNGNSAAGSAYVIFGKTDGFDPLLNLSELDGMNGYRLDGANNSDNAGRSVSNAGDFNNDQIDDLMIGTSGVDANLITDAGSTYVVFGSDQTPPASVNLSTLDGSNGLRLDGVSISDMSGESVSGGGDVNSDGIDDVIVGAFRADPNGVNFAGTSYVIFGSGSDFASTFAMSTLDGTNGILLNGTGNNDRSGTSVSGAGDINGDGIDDFVIGASGFNDNSSEGASYLIFGSSDPFAAEIDLSSLDGSDGFSLIGAQNDESGNAVSAAGDVNGDGIDDFVIGAYSTNHGHSNAGSAYVVFGKTSPFDAILNLPELDGTNGFRLDGIQQDDHVGQSVSGAGDLNGDGMDDLIVGASGSGFVKGFVQVIFGTSSFDAVIDVDETEGLRFDGGDGDRLGYSVSSAGDINGDGLDDIIIGAPGTNANEQSDTGAAYVILGRLTPMPPIVANSLPDHVASEQEPFNFSIPANTFEDPNNANSQDIQTLSATQVGGIPLPGWLTFDPETGTFAGTPEIGDGGVLHVTVKSTDEDGLSASDDFVIDINYAPKLTISDRQVEEESELSFILAATDANNPTQALNYTLDGISTASGMTLDETSGEFRWIPTEHQDGAHLATVTISDGFTTVEANFTIVVQEVNVAPVVDVIEDQSVNENVELVLDLQASDVDAPAQLLTYTLDATSASTGMTVQASTGIFQWTPNESQDGTYEVELTVSDGLTAISQMFTIVVTEVNTEPVPESIPNQTTLEGNVIVFAVAVTDIDQPVQQLSYSLDATSIGKGMNIDIMTGVFDWVPDESDDGTHDVTITVDDGVASVNEMFTITVEEVLRIEDWTTEEVRLYPNPTNGEFILILENGFIGNAQVNVQNLEGKVLRRTFIEKTTKRHEELLEISDLESGMYFLELQVEGKRMGMHRIIKK